MRAERIEMKLNEIIRTKRKEQNLTQEEAAKRLGVSASAFNKWEKGNACPDIAVLPALARLLKTDLNTLFSFREELTEQEIGLFCEELSNTIRQKGFEIGYAAAMEKLQEYPDCGPLISMTASTLDGALFIFAPALRDSYSEQLEQLYERAALCEDMATRDFANYMLAGRCMQRGDYDRAEELLNRLTDKPAVDKNHMKANLFVKLGRLDEAAQMLEGKLMAAASDVQSALLALMTLALKENDMEAAGYLAEVSQKSACLLESWKYNSYVAAFELAAAKKDGDTCMEMLSGMADAMQKPWLFSQSRLYRHIPQKKSDFSEMLPGLLASIKSDEDMDFLRSRADFNRLLAQHPPA